MIAEIVAIAVWCITQREFAMAVFIPLLASSIIVLPFICERLGLE